MSHKSGVNILLSLSEENHLILTKVGYGTSNRPPLSRCLHLDDVGDHTVSILSFSNGSAKITRWPSHWGPRDPDLTPINLDTCSERKRECTVIYPPSLLSSSSISHVWPSQENITCCLSTSLTRPWLRKIRPGGQGEGHHTGPEPQTALPTPAPPSFNCISSKTVSAKS